MGRGMHRVNAAVFLFAWVSLGTVVSSSLAAQDDWPQWRGPNRDGRSLDTGLLRRWPQSGPPLRWSFDGLGTGYSTVAVVDGVVYTTGTLDDTDMLFALDTRGRRRWQREIGPSWTKNYPGARSTPTIHNGDVYVMAGAGVLACFDAHTGRKKWSVDIIKDFRGRLPRWGLAESVLLTDEAVICTPGGPEASVVALDKSSGRTLWASKGHSEVSSYCSPLLVSSAQEPFILTMTERSLLALSPSDGEVLWTHGHVNSFRVNANTPVFDDNMIFVASGYRKGAEMLTLSPGSTPPEVQWAEATLDCHHGGVVLVDGYIYGSANSGKWICLELKTGKIMYEARSVGKGALTYADGMLYCYGETGRVALVPATPTGHQAISKFRITRGKGRHWAHPVVAGKTLYIRHGEVLMVYNISRGG